MSLPHLPIELQREIIKYLPQRDWFRVIDNKLLSLGLNDSFLWHIINLDDFDEISEHNEILLKRFGAKINKLHWHSVKISSLLTLDALASKWENIFELNLAENTNLESIRFTRNLQGLKVLNLSGCTQLKRVPLVNIVCTLNNLTDLNLSECAQIKEKDIVRIISKLKKLNHFNVRDTIDLEIEFVNTVDLLLPTNSEFLFCAKIGFSVLDEWEEIHLKYPRLQICPATLEFLLEHRPFLD